jgi:hypothetical protein
MLSKKSVSASTSESKKTKSVEEQSGILQPKLRLSTTSQEVISMKGSDVDIQALLADLEISEPFVNVAPHSVSEDTSLVPVSTLANEQESPRQRMIKDHGPLTTLLLFLEFHDQVKIGSLCRRAYNITVPWNMAPALLPIDSFCDFPNLKIPSADHVIKGMEAIIEDRTGTFYGIFRKSTGIPDGYGVFVCGDWVLCGEVKNGIYQDGRQVSVNKKERQFLLFNQKTIADGSVLLKVEVLTAGEVWSGLFKDGIKISELTPSLNRDKHA